MKPSSELRVPLETGAAAAALVYPAAGLPEIAKAAGAYTVEINPELTPLSGLCDEVIQGKAGEILPLF